MNDQVNGGSTSILQGPTRARWVILLLLNLHDFCWVVRLRRYMVDMISIPRMEQRCQKRQQSVDLQSI